MNISKYISIVCAALMVSACADEVKDIITPENPEEGGNKEEEVVEMIPVTVTVTENSSRVSHTDNGNTITVAWEEGDKIYLGSPTEDTSDKCINADGSGFTTLNIDASSISEDKKTANFTGEIPYTLNGKTLLAFYGKAENLKVNGGNVIMDFTEQAQSTEDLAHLKDYDLMSAVVQNYDGSNNINLQFKHEGAIFKVNLTQLPERCSLSKVTLSLPEGTNNFVTSKSFNANGEATNRQIVNKLELNIGTISDATYNAVFTLCPTTLSSDMNISASVTTPSGAYSYTDKINISNATLEAGKYYWTPELLLVPNNTIEGAGTSESPYIIDNVEKFSSISGEAGKFYSITQDMNFSGATITPIETFAGTLDGGNKTLSNFNISGNDAALFKVNTGTIRKLNITNANVTGTPTSNNNYAGIMIGSNSGTIENCTISASNVTISGSSTGGGNIGGFAGINGGKITDCTITDINVNANVPGRTGGFVGHNTGTLTGCASANDVSLNVNHRTGNQDIGGLIGWNGGNGKITACYSHTDITISNIVAHKIGGLIGSAGSNNTITLCYSAGSISSVPNGSAVGGLIGKAADKWSTPITVTSCYTITTLPTAEGNTVVSGFAGKNDAVYGTLTCTSCYFTNHTNAVHNSAFAGVEKRTVETLKGEASVMNNAVGEIGYEFTVGSGDVPLNITKK